MWTLQFFGQPSNAGSQQKSDLETMLAKLMGDPLSLVIIVFRRGTLD